MDAYILTDRTTAQKYAVSVADGVMQYIDSSADAMPEPILKDGLTGAFWKVFIADGQIGIESTVESTFTTIILTDSETALNWSLEVYDGQMRIAQRIKFIINLDSKIEKTISLSSGLPA